MSTSEEATPVWFSADEAHAWACGWEAGHNAASDAGHNALVAVIHVTRTRIEDDRRERADRTSVCCAPEMCPTCFDNGGHAR